MRGDALRDQLFGGRRHDGMRNSDGDAGRGCADGHVETVNVESGVGKRNAGIDDDVGHLEQPFARGGRDGVCVECGSEVTPTRAMPRSLHSTAMSMITALMPECENSSIVSSGSSW